MVKILITGGAGFIGSHLAKKMIEDEHDVVAIDNFDSYYPAEIKKSNLENIPNSRNFKFINADLTNYRSIHTIVRDEHVEIIVHEAARPGVRSSIQDPQLVNKQNVDATLGLLKIAYENNIDYFINASSSSVYGEPLYLPLDENHSTNPISPYGVSKLAAEYYTKCFYQTFGLPTLSLRHFTVYGPRMRPDLAIFSFTKSITEHKSPFVFGDGEQKRDFIYIDDVIEAIIKAIEHRPKGEIINIGTGNQISVNTLLHLLMDIIGVHIQPQ